MWLFPLRTGLLRSCWAELSSPTRAFLPSSHGVSFFLFCVSFHQPSQLVSRECTPAADLRFLFLKLPHLRLPTPHRADLSVICSGALTVTAWVPAGRRLSPTVSTSMQPPSLLCEGFFQLRGLRRVLVVAQHPPSLCVVSTSKGASCRKARQNPHHPQARVAFPGKSKLSLGGALASVTNRIFLPYCLTFIIPLLTPERHFICSWITKNYFWF